MSANPVSPKIVIFCPLPPKPNGIADYLYEQLPYLATEASVTVVVPDEQIVLASLPSGVTALRRQQYLQRRDEFNGHQHVYHVGNNADTVYLLPIAHETPGTVVIHDLNLHHLVDLCTLAQGEFDSYTAALTHDYGHLGQVLGRQTKKYRLKGNFSTSQLQLNASLIDNAQQVIVHSNYAQKIVLGRDQKNVSVIPHHLATKALEIELDHQAYRSKLELPLDRPIFTSMGFIAKAKQITAILEALAELKAQGMKFLYVLAGQCKVDEYDVHTEILRLGLSDYVKVTGFLDEDDFYHYLAASDFIINLRYPSGGETSGTLTRALGMGLCCLVINLGPFGELPEGTAYKIEYDETFDEQLKQAIELLASDTDLRNRIGAKAASWVRSTQTLEITIPSYLRVINRAKPASALSPVWSIAQLNCNSSDRSPIIISAHTNGTAPIGTESIKTLLSSVAYSKHLRLSISSSLLSEHLNSWLILCNHILSVDAILELEIIRDGQFSEERFKSLLPHYGFRALETNTRSILDRHSDNNAPLKLSATLVSRMLYLTDQSHNRPMLLTQEVALTAIETLSTLSMEISQGGINAH